MKTTSHPSITVCLAIALRRNCPSVRLVYALGAARYLLSVSQAERNRYRLGGFTRCASSLRSMAFLARS